MLDGTALISVNIDYLGHHPQFAPVIAQWHQDEWRHISPDLTTELRVKLYNSYSNSVDIPTCFLALADDQPVGSASLVVSDLQTHPQLGPWLASVYVHENYRRQGIASQLLQRCIESAREANVKKLYLFTPDQCSFYLKRGWILIESTLYHGENIDIMEFDVSGHI